MPDFYDVGWGITVVCWAYFWFLSVQSETQIQIFLEATDYARHLPSSELILHVENSEEDIRINNSYIHVAS